MFLKEPFVCRKPVYEITGTGLKTPMRVALTGDWHVSHIVSEKQRQFLKTRLAEIRPDLIILQGDMFDTPDAFDEGGLVSELKKSLKVCTDRAPTVMVLGNHDQICPRQAPAKTKTELLRRVRPGIIDEWKRLAKECKIKLLLDSWVEFGGLRLFGFFQDPEAYYLGPKRRGNGINYMRQRIKALNDEGAFKFKGGKVHWFVAHAPIKELYIMRELKDFRVFSFGHTHGGCMPLVADSVADFFNYHGGIVEPYLKWFPRRFVRGREKLKSGADFIVNTGMVMAQENAPKMTQLLNFLKAAEITEIVVR